MNSAQFAINLFIFSSIVTFITSISPEDLRKKKTSLVKKHLKRLKKQEGALKLVGGSGEHEGK